MSYQTRYAIKEFSPERFTILKSVPVYSWWGFGNKLLYEKWEPLMMAYANYHDIDERVLIYPNFEAAETQVKGMLAAQGFVPKIIKEYP